LIQIKAIIADDEEPLRTYLRSLLSDVWPDLIICGEARNGREALELVEKHKPHIAFLDIKMPGLSGMEVAKKIGKACRVVFVTAYDRYAVEAFENEAIDYLLKPVTRVRLERAVKRLRKQIDAPHEQPQSDITEVTERILAELKEREAREYLQWIKVQRLDGILLVPVEEVCYFKASDKYTMVMTEEGESLIKKTIRELSDDLDPNQFWRIHRGTIVNLSRIAKVSRSLTGRGAMRLKDRPEILTVSRSYMHLFRQM